MRSANYNLLTFFFSISCLIANTSVTAQDIEADIKSYAQKYPGETGVFLQHKQFTEINIVKDELEIIETENEEVFYFGDKAKYYSQNKIHSSSLVKLQSCEAFMQEPVKGKYKTQKISNFEKYDSYSSYSFYDDGQITSFSFPGLSKGYITNVTSVKSYEDPRLYGAYFFGSYLPVENSVLEIVCDKDVELKWTPQNIDTALVNFSITERGNKVTYSWQMSDIPKMVSSEQEPSVRYFEPHILVRISQYTHKGEVIKVLPDLGHLHKWYSSLIDRIELQPGETLSLLSDSICKDKSTDLEKVKAIYYWVQDNIKYIAIEDGMAGFIPRDASLVLHRRYGDCKDMANLIKSLIQEQGIEANLTWIGTRDIPYTYEEVPTPYVDNHMICTYFDGTDNYFLDATNKYLPLDYPSIFTQGKEALLHISKDSYKVEKVPVISKEANVYNDTVNVFLTETQVMGNGKSILSGYFNSEMMNAINSLTEKELKEYFTYFFRKGNNKSFVDVGDIAFAEQRETPMEMNYQFTISDYLKNLDGEIYFNPHLTKRFLDLEINLDQIRYGIERDYKQMQNYHLSLSIPEGYHLKHLPEASSSKKGKFGYDVKYMYDELENSVKVDLSFYEDFIVLPKADIQLYNDMISDMRSSFSQNIIIKKDEN